METKIRSYSPPGEAGQGRKERWQRCRWLGLLIMLFMLAGFGHTAKAWSNSDPTIVAETSYKTLKTTKLGLSFDLNMAETDGAWSFWGDWYHYIMPNMYIYDQELPYLSEFNKGIDAYWKPAANKQVKWPARTSNEVGWIGVRGYWWDDAGYIRGGFTVVPRYIYIDQPLKLKVTGYWHRNGVDATNLTTLTVNADISQIKAPEWGTISRSQGQISYSGSLTNADITNYDWSLTLFTTQPGATTYVAPSSSNCLDGMKSAAAGAKNINVTFDNATDYYHGYILYPRMSGVRNNPYIHTDPYGNMSTDGSTLIKDYDAIKIPGYPRATNVSVEGKKWTKTVNLSWSSEIYDSNNCSTSGTWSVFRKNLIDNSMEVVGSDIGYNTRSFTDDSETLDYSIPYTYYVCFVPNGWTVNSWTDANGLWASKDFKLLREYQFRSFVAEGGESDIALNWGLEAFSNASNNNQYQVVLQRSVNSNSTWTDIYTQTVNSSTTTTGSYTDTDVSNPCNNYIYRLMVQAQDTTFYSVEKVSGITGTSKVISISASRGTYNGRVRVTWEAEQHGTDPTYFKVNRRPLGSGDNKWVTLYSTNGTAASYDYQDDTALPGEYYEYQVVSETRCESGGTTSVKTFNEVTDGFCIAHGVVSGRISYGTGTAVNGVRVTLTPIGNSGNDVQAFYSLRLQSAGDGVRWPVPQAMKTTSTTTPAYTIQFFLRPETDDASRTANAILLEENDASTALLQLSTYDATNQRYQLILGGSASGVYVKPNVFTFITLRYDGTNFTLSTVDINQEVSSYSKTGAGLSAESLHIGYSSDMGKPQFQGYLDEIRIYSRALPDAEILTYSDHKLAGTEDALVAYIPLDEGIQVLNKAYDYSKTSGAANGNHGDLAGGTFSTMVPNSVQLGLLGYTDTEGNYVIRGVPFNGEGTQYNIAPSLGIHGFSPARQSRYVSASSLVHSGVDFEDVSSFPVSGVIYYEHTDYPVEGVNLYVDGTICAKDGKAIETDKDGKYTISVPIGDHYITVGKNGHTFAKDGRYPDGVGQRFTFDREMTGLTFYDNTLVTVTGRLVGGDTEGNKPLGMALSENNIGQARVTLSLQDNNPYRLNVVENISGTTYSIDNNPEQLTVVSPTTDVQSTAWRTGGTHASDVKSIVIETDPNTGEFAALVPPLLYKVQSVEMISDKAEASFSGVTFSDIDATNPLMEYTDSTDAYNEIYHKEFKYNARLAQTQSTYHCTPTFTVTQLNREDGLFGDQLAVYYDNLTNKTDTLDAIVGGAYKFTYPLFEQNATYKFKLKAYEQYTNYDDADNVVTTTVPMKNTVVTIDNEMSANRAVFTEAVTLGGKTYKAGDIVDTEAIKAAGGTMLTENQLQLDEKGEAIYVWKAGFPNINEDDGMKRPLSINYEYNNQSKAWTGNPLYGIIIGALPSGSNFATAGPDKVDMIIRDPGGTGSSASWEKGVSHTRVDTDIVTTATEDKINTVSHLGTKKAIAEGAGVIGPITMIITEAQVTANLTVGLETSYTYEGTHSESTTTTTTKRISTSDDPAFVGADGDVFIGTSTNLIFGNARQVCLQKETNGSYKIGCEDGMVTSTEFGTDFMYTQHYIENTLIPNLEALRNDLLKPVDASTYNNYKNTTDEVKYITTLSEDDPRFGSDNDDKKIWGNNIVTKGFTPGPSYYAVKPANGKGAYQDMVSYYNESIRNWKAQLALNEKQKVQVINRKAGKFIKNYSFDGGTSFERTTSIEVQNDSVYSNSFTLHLVAGVEHGFEWDGTGVDGSIETNTGSGMTYVDEEHGTTSDAFSFTLAETGDDALSVDVYDSPSGFGPIFVTRAGQTSCPYEDETVTKYYQPGTSIGAATMKIEDPKLTVVDAKNVLNDVPRGGKAVFQLQLENLSETKSDATYSLVPVDGTNEIGALLSLPTGPLGNGHSYVVRYGEKLIVPLTLQQNNTDVYDYENIGIALQSSCGDLESEVRLTAHFVPSSSDVALTADKSVLNTTVGDVLTLKVRDYDAQYENLKYIRVQYKALGDATWSTIPGQEYYVDDQYAASNTQELPSGGVITVEFPMENYVDGTYQFRAQTATAHGNSEITKESEVITIVKDMKKPQLFGNANPSDGVLNAGDEISVTFNEDIRQSMLTEPNNFKITAALNGQKIAHSVALDGQATECAAKTDANINLAHKDFTTDLWVNYTGAGTLLSHGNGSEKFEVGTDASGHLTVKIGENTYASTNTITQNKWVFLTLNYQNADAGGVLNALFAEDDSQTMLFTDQAVAAYEGSGALTVGKQLTGAIHELTLWDKARDCVEAQAEMYYTKKPSTPHLIGYWKMDEGEGVTIRDYARNRHLTMPAETWYVNNVNQSVTLNGSQAMKVNISECNALPTEDYALELWFKSNQAANATLFSTGSSEQAIQMGFNADGALTLTTKGTTRVMTNNNYRDNVWHHLALNVLRNGNATIYVDGTPVNTIPASSVGSLTGSELVIGASKVGNSSYSTYFNGSVDEVRYWKATLTGDYLKRQKSVRLTGKEAGLMAYYPFEHKELDGNHQIVTTTSLADQRMVYNKGEEEYQPTGKVATMTSGSVSYSATNVPRLKEAPTVTNISFNFVANERTIVINLTNKAEELEGTTVDFEVKAVLDANGNESEAIHWTAFVKQNQLLWKDETEVNVEKKNTNSATFEATIINESGSSENWMLSGLPAWLIANIESGTLKAQQSKTITFTVSESLPIGKYETTVYLTGNKNIAAPLTINVKSKGDEPLWSVNTGDYEESMNVIGSLQIIGVPSQDEDDIVGAFIGNECRGVARPKYMQKFDGYFVTMDIYGSGGENGQPVELKVFDASTGIIYPVVKTYKPGESTASTLTFEANTLQGRYTTPLRFDVTDEIEQNIELAKGWNWMSLSVRPGETPSDMTTSVVFAKADGKVKTVKGQAGSATYSGGSWISNSLTTMTNADMYAVNSSEAFVLNVTGHRVNPAETPVTVKNGWNWVGYCGQQVVSVADALAAMTPTDGDIIKGQKGVAYFDGSEWNGSLQTLVPGKGYKLQSAASANRTLYYPTTTAASARMLDDERVTPKVFEAVDYSNYPANMVVIAKVVKNGMPMAFAELGVFAGSECREAAVTDGQGMVYITVPGDNSTKLTFRVAEDEFVLKANESVDYKTDAVIGTPRTPFFIELGTATAVGFVATESQQTEQVFDLQGRKVKVDDQTRKLRKGVYIVNGQKQVK